MPIEGKDNEWQRNMAYKNHKDQAGLLRGPISIASGMISNFLSSLFCR